MGQQPGVGVDRTPVVRQHISRTNAYLALVIFQPVKLFGVVVNYRSAE
jgi:hypothetical protein